MRITPLSIISSVPKIYQNRLSAEQTNPIYINNKIQTDTVSFGRSANNGELLRKLIPYKIPDMYTGIILLDSNVLEQWLQKKVFSQPIQNLVKFLKPYEETLHSVKKTIFTSIEQIAKSKQRIMLDDAIKILSAEAQNELHNIQQPIFDELISVAKGMPQEQKAIFDKLMDKTIKQVTNKAILSDFNKTDFRYKLTRIAMGIKQRGIDSEIKSIKQLINMSKLFPEQPKFKNLASIRNHKKNGKTTDVIQQEQANAIRKIEKYFIFSPLNQDKELQDLITKAKNQIFHIPTIIPFSRKNFISELESITKTLDNQKYAHKLIKIAQKLPTSHQEPSAFIMKESRNSAEKIGYDLFEGSVATLDHLVPFSKGGKDTLTNYGLASSYINSTRGNIPLNVYIRKHPEIYKNCQKHVNRLIELNNDGTFKKIGLNKWYIIRFSEAMKKLSPEENPILIDLSKLK